MREHPILIFDGLNTFIRNFSVSPYMDANGNDVGGLVGTLRSVKQMVRELDPQKLIVVWDGEGGSRRRRGVFAEYKAGRKPRLNRELDENSPGESKQNMEWQLAMTKRLLGHIGAIQIELGDIEADDAIGYLVGLFDGLPKVVVSSDKDMWQLVSETTTVYWPTKKIYITPGNFGEQVEVLPCNFVLYRALSVGDASDNIKGLKGLGPKTILKVFPELSLRPFSLNELLVRCKGADMEYETAHPPTPLQKKWFQAVLDQAELLTQSVSLMQLTIPNISAQSAAIIRNSTEREPSFNQLGFKMALMNLALQIPDGDLFTTFKTYQARVQSK